MTDHHESPPRTGPIVIATTRPWNRALVDTVAKAVGADAYLIDDPADLTAAKLDMTGPSHVFFPHWSHIIPAAVFERYQCIIFHMTDVPFGRGGSPLQNLIARGIYETKISALRCVAELDAGDVYLQRPLSLHGNAEEIYLRARGIMGEMIIDILTNNPMPTPQHGAATVFRRRRPEESDISDLTTLDALFDWIRMLDADGYPRAFAEVGAFHLEFSRAARRHDGVHADVRISLAPRSGNDDG